MIIYDFLQNLVFVSIVGLFALFYMIVALYRENKTTEKKDVESEKLEELDHKIHYLRKKIESQVEEIKELINNKSEDAIKSALQNVYSDDIKSIVSEKYAKEATDSYLQSEVFKIYKGLTTNLYSARSKSDTGSVLSLFSGIAFAVISLIPPLIKIIFHMDNSQQLGSLRSLFVIINEAENKTLVSLSFPYLSVMLIFGSLSAFCFKIYSKNKEDAKKLSQLIFQVEANKASILVALYKDNEHNLFNALNQLPKSIEINSLFNSRSEIKQSKDINIGKLFKFNQSSEEK